MFGPNISSAAGGQASVLFRFNDRQLPGFHDEHVKELVRAKSLTSNDDGDYSKQTYHKRRVGVG